MGQLMPQTTHWIFDLAMLFISIFCQLNWTIYKKSLGTTTYGICNTGFRGTKPKTQKSRKKRTQWCSHNIGNRNYHYEHYFQLDEWFFTTSRGRRFFRIQRPKWSISRRPRRSPRQSTSIRRHLFAFLYDWARDVGIGFILQNGQRFPTPSRLGESSHDGRCAMVHDSVIYNRTLVVWYNRTSESLRLRLIVHHI